MLKMNILLSRPLIKINACLIGYGLWLILSQYHYETRNVTMPVSFYHLPATYQVEAPETIQATLHGKKSLLQLANKQEQSVHIDVSTLHTGKNRIFLTKDNLFLPDRINVVQLIPSYIEVDIKKEA